MVENAFSTAVFCVASAILAVLLRQYVREQSLFISLAACVAVTGALFGMLTPVLDDIRDIFLDSGLPESYISLVFKATAICLITQITSDLCRDSGETAIASAAELWGRGAVTFISLPLVRTLISRITEIL
ncbi:stage III sporulation protein AD [Ruminococcus sp. YRD2003]|uniref:stage III sporulation AC/AD family protein n=1 Tax=Ruminococcus sp. YRD2003 TaxID=1452313 RepID=UPI0008BBFC54|nr:stage III sporulation protein AD [Ruminococcus flavefaciens]